MAHCHSFKKITIAQAEKQGFTVDTNCYPHFGYKGSRFRPDESVDVYTGLEAELLEFKTGLVGMWATDLPNRLTDEEKSRCQLFEIK